MRHEEELRPRVVALAPGTDLEGERAGVWLVDRTATYAWRAVHSDSGHELESPHYGMVTDYLHLLGLTRHDPCEGDPPGTVERWTLD